IPHRRLRPPPVAPFFLHPAADHRDLHSFPTRRSSDLPPTQRPTPFALPVCSTLCASTSWVGQPRANTTSCAGWATIKSRQAAVRSEEHTSELQSRENLVCRLLLEKKKRNKDERPQQNT